MPISFQFQGLILYKPVLNYTLNDPNGDVGKYLKRVGRTIVIAARKQVGVDTGLLRSTIRMVHYRSVAGQYLWIGSEDPIALMHHEGTKPHIITPKRHEFLRFTSGGRVIYSRMVMHPGTRPNRYLSDNLILVHVQ